MACRCAERRRKIGQAVTAAAAGDRRLAAQRLAEVRASLRDEARRAAMAAMRRAVQVWGAG